MHGNNTRRHEGEGLIMLWELRRIQHKTTFLSWWPQDFLSIIYLPFSHSCVPERRANSQNLYLQTRRSHCSSYFYMCGENKVHKVAQVFATWLIYYSPWAYCIKKTNITLQSSKMQYFNRCILKKCALTWKPTPYQKRSLALRQEMRLR